MPSGEESVVFFHVYWNSFLFFLWMAMERKCPENELDDGSFFFFFIYLGIRFKVETVRKPLAFIEENMNGI